MATPPSPGSPKPTTRRGALLGGATFAGMWAAFTARPSAAAVTDPMGMVWRKVAAGGTDESLYYSPTFKTYLARFLLQYDSTCAEWWRTLPPSSRELSDPTWRRFRSSVDEGLASDWSAEDALATAGSPLALCENLVERFARRSAAPPNRDVLLQLAVLFELLDESVRPRALVRSLIRDAGGLAPGADAPSSDNSTTAATLKAEAAPAALDAGTAWWLLPTALYPLASDKTLDHETVTAAALAVSADLRIAEGRATMPVEAEATSDIAVAAAAPLSRERPLGTRVYSLFALAGAMGCTLTHSLLVPLDVVKTKKQTDPEAYLPLSLVDGARRVVATEGVSGLARGFGPTLVGYTWYGLTVYPGYEFFKRLLFAMFGQFVVPLRVPLVLLAGALATCVACIGVCPAETVRIRCVAEPSLGDSWAVTKSLVQNEGVASLFSGLSPLLVRQVLFGMTKFLVFDFFTEALYERFPSLPSEGLPALLVSLLAGAVAGIVSTVVSQPGDAVLTKLAQYAGAGQLGVVGAARLIWRQDGLSGFFYGLAPRALWAGCIIAGQFFLYDLFKAAVHVTAADLSQTLDALGTAGVSGTTLM